MMVLVALRSLLAVAGLFGQLRGHQVWDVAPLACLMCLDKLCTWVRERRESQQQS